MKLRVAATRLLAILGENERVRRAVGRPAIAGRRGIRILSMDGGGAGGKPRIAATSAVQAVHHALPPLHVVSLPDSRRLLGCCLCLQA